MNGPIVMRLSPPRCIAISNSDGKAGARGWAPIHQSDQKSIRPTPTTTHPKTKLEASGHVKYPTTEMRDVTRKYMEDENWVEFDLNPHYPRPRKTGVFTLQTPNPN